jgi:hypothetical protein
MIFEKERKLLSREDDYVEALAGNSSASITEEI